MFDRVSILERRFRRIARSLKPFELQRIDEPVALTEADIFGEVVGQARAHRFLGYYSDAGLRRVFEAYGLSGQLAEKGFPALRLELLLDDPFRHRLKVYAEGESGGRGLIMDFAAHLGTGRELGQPGPDWGGELLVIDWLMLQDPRTPAEGCRLLPGQRCPGLGLGLEVGTLITQIAHRLNLDGCLAFPAWYHNAAFYHHRYRFVSPAVEGRFRALERDSAGIPIDEVSWAIELGAVTERMLGAHGGSPWQVLRWQGRPMLYCLSPQLRAFFEDEAWKGIRDATRDGVQFYLDREKARALREGGRS